MWIKIKNNIFNHIWELFALLIPTIIALVLTWYPINKLNLISSKIYISIIIILILLLFILVKLIITTINLIENNNVVLPRLKIIKNNRLIFEPAEIFSSQSIVSIYYKKDYEECIGYGIIETIISDSKMIQVIIKEYSSGWDENKVNKIKNNIILKPSIPASLLEKLGE